MRKVNPIGKVWRWLGQQENHNALITLIAIGTLIVALPFFSRQINNIQIHVASIETDIKELFNRQKTESFSKSQFITFEVTPKDKLGDQYLKIPLKYIPVENSIMLWFGGVVQPPTEYKIEGHFVSLRITPAFDEESLKNLSSEIPIIINYIKAQ